MGNIFNFAGGSPDSGVHRSELNSHRMCRVYIGSRNVNCFRRHLIYANNGQGYWIIYELVLDGLVRYYPARSLSVQACRYVGEFTAKEVLEACLLTGQESGGFNLFKDNSNHWTEEAYFNLTGRRIEISRFTCPCKHHSRATASNCPGPVVPPFAVPPAASEYSRFRYNRRRPHGRHTITPRKTCPGPVVHPCAFPKAPTECNFHVS
jgi:hypothetical protein